MRLTYKTQCAWEALKRLSKSPKPLCLDDLWDGAGPKEACRSVVESLSRTGWVKKERTLYSITNRELSLEDVRRLVEQHFNPDNPFSAITAIVREVLSEVRLGEDMEFVHPSSKAILARLKKEVEEAREKTDCKERFSEKLKTEIIHLANVEGTTKISEELGFYPAQIYTWRRQLPNTAKEIVKELKKPNWEECLEKHLKGAEDAEEEEHRPVLTDHTLLQPGPIAEGLKEKEKARKVLCSITFHNGTKVDVYE